MRGKSGVDEQPLAPGYRMGSDHWMHRLGIGVVAHAVDAAAEISLIGRASGMTGFEAIEVAGKARRQRLIGIVHTGEYGIAADVGHGVEVEHAGRRRRLVTGHIAMPALPGKPFGRGVRMNAIDPGMTVQIAHGMDMQVTETASHILELFDI